MNGIKYKRLVERLQKHTKDVTLGDRTALARLDSMMVNHSFELNIIREMLVTLCTASEIIVFELCVLMDKIAQHQKLDRDFMYEYREYLSWEIVCHYQDVPDDLLVELKLKGEIE